MLIQNCSFPFPVSGVTMNGNFSGIVTKFVLFGSTASGIIGTIVYTARQIVTKEDLRDTKEDIVKLIEDNDRKNEDRYKTILAFINSPK